MSARLHDHGWRAIIAVGAFVGLFVSTVSAEAPRQKGLREPRGVVGTCGPVAGVLLQRTAPNAPWKFLDEGESVRPEALLVALPDADIFAGNRKVLLHMAADLGHRGPLPVYESAVILHHNPKVDLDFTFDRGVAMVANQRKKGAARVRVRFVGETWDLTLKTPDTQVGLEIYGRHPPGAPKFEEEGGRLKIKQSPTHDLYLLVIKGQASLRTGDQEITLDAPPGPAKLHWDSVARRIAVMHLDKLPPGLKPQTAEEMQSYQELCQNIRQLRTGSIDTVLNKALQSETPLKPKGAVVILGALDKLPRLAEVLAASSVQEARDKSIVVLRNWVGRGDGQLEKLYEFLTSEKKLSPAQAKTALHLLLGFDEDEQRQPDTYEVLIDSLKHSKLAVRELARWHLARLSPEGNKIGYDAGAPADQRERAYEQWRALIPPGQLPPQLRAPPATEKPRR
jgi:hypothetical protein